MSNWNPVEQPYRVLVTLRTNAPGMHGWTSYASVHATLEEAVAKANEPVKGRLMDVTLWQARNPQEWSERGSWKALAKRVAKQVFAADLSVSERRTA